MSTPDKPTAEDTEADKRDTIKADEVEDAEIVEESQSAAAGGPWSDDPAPDDPARKDPSPDAPGGAEAEESRARGDVSDEPGRGAGAAGAAGAMPEGPDHDSEKFETPEDPPPSQPPAPVEVPRIGRGPGFLTLLLGGLIAGAIGYALAYATEFRPFAADTASDPVVVALQDGLAAQTDRVAALESQLAQTSDAANAAGEEAAEASARASTVSASLAELDAQVTQLTPGQDDIPPALVDQLQAAAAAEVTALADRLSATEDQLATVQSQLDDVASQVAALGGAGAQSATEQLDAYAAQLQTLQDELDAQRAAIAEAEARTSEMTAAARAQQTAVLAEAALARVRAAVTGGGSFAGPLAELRQTGAMIPDALQATADSGVKTLPQLQESFSSAARAGLQAAIGTEAGTGSTMDRFGNFLRSQTGARSLAEREGDDPDAVLSRAEARLSEGNVAAALTEIAALNEAGQAAMAPWVAEAEARIAALQAVDDLSAALAAE